MSAQKERRGNRKNCTFRIALCLVHISVHQTHPVFRFFALPCSTQLKYKAFGAEAGAATQQLAAAAVVASSSGLICAGLLCQGAVSVRRLQLGGCRILRSSLYLSLFSEGLLSLSTPNAFSI